MSSISNVCSMTGNTLSDPVVSKKSGHVFQKAAITKHLSSFPYCPITNQALELSDLVEIKQMNQNANSNKPSQSVNVFMEKLQHQYDTIILQSHSLKKNLSQTKEELLHCKYRNEAAQRAIGKLLAEKQQSEREIMQLQGKLSKIQSK